jgi:protein TonB
MSSNANLFKQSWLNTIFDGRNKSYGAYELRQTNPKTTLIALFFGALFFTGAIAIPVIKNLISELANAEEEVIREVKLDKINKPKEEKKEEILEEKKPEEQKKTQTVQDIQKFVPPVVVDKQEVKEELATIEELKDKNVGNQTMAGNPDGDLVMDNSASEEKSNDAELIDYNKPFEHVEVPASPPGGINAFRKRIATDFRVPEVDETIMGNVIAKFVVAVDGSISDIKIIKENPPGLGLGKEATRLLAKYPKWTAGMNNGRSVPSYFTLPISIQISASE